MASPSGDRFDPGSRGGKPDGKVLSDQVSGSRSRAPIIDGSSQDWWTLEVNIRPYGPEKPERIVIATTDPASLPDLTTFYLVTNLPAPGSERAQSSELATASLEEVVRLYGLRMWVEQSYKQVKYAASLVELSSQESSRPAAALAVGLLCLLVLLVSSGSRGFHRTAPCSDSGRVLN